MKIYAGLDRDGIAKLFLVQDGKIKTIGHQEWLEIVDDLDLEPGEMPVVFLYKEREVIPSCYSPSDKKVLQVGPNGQEVVDFEDLPQEIQDKIIEIHKKRTG